jgi:predicted small metal-binding protein
MRGGHVARQPALPPRAQLAHHGGQLQAGLRQPVLRAAALATLEHPRIDQRAQARREHRARNARDTAMDHAEAAAAAEQLAHDEQRPPLAEQVEGARHRAELTVGLHARTIRRPRGPPQYGFRTTGRVRGRLGCRHRARGRRAAEEEDVMKKVEMEKVLRCADVSGTSCQFVARGQTMDEILQQAGQHAVEGHGLTVTPELVEAVKARVTQA